VVIVVALLAVTAAGGAVGRAEAKLVATPCGVHEAAVRALVQECGGGTSDPKDPIIVKG
jgi:hypothetical protein